MVFAATQRDDFSVAIIISKELNYDPKCGQGFGKFVNKYKERQKASNMHFGPTGSWALDGYTPVPYGKISRAKITTLNSSTKYR